MTTKKKKRIIVIAIAVVGAAALAVPLAGAGLAATVAASERGSSAGLEWVDDDDGPEFTEYQPTAEEIAGVNALEQELSAYLTERGVAHSVSIDEHGMDFVELDDPDQAAWDAYDAFWAERFPLSEAEAAWLNDETEAMVADLAAQGHAVATHTTADGLVILDREQPDGVDDAISAWYLQSLGTLSEEGAQ